MTLYVYEGRNPAIRVKGVVLHRGVPVELTGSVAARAERHSAVRAVRESAAEVVEVPPPPPPPPPGRPPTSGPGSGVGAWREYAAKATDSPVESWSSLSRDEIIELLGSETGGRA